MKVVIIHDSSRLERRQLVDNLLEIYPEAVVVPAIKPTLERTASAQAIRGCSLAHLSAAEQFGECLVLEDDAVFTGEKIELGSWPAISGIVLLGAETERVTDHVFQGGYRQVLPKFWGTQAVVYTDKLLRETDFLKNAYKVLACNHADNLCLESILLTACPLPIFRPTTMPFTTAEVVSARTGELQHKRSIHL